MAAVITETFRRNNAKQMYDEINSDSQVYYIGLGKNDPWKDDGVATSYDTPAGSSYQAKDVLMNLIAMKSVVKTQVQFVIPRINYVSGSTYKSWDPADSNCWYATGTTLPCYAVSSGHLYLCVRSGAGSASSGFSGSEVIGTLIGDGSSGDGYIWVRLQDATNTITNALYTSKWYPVFKIASPSNTTTNGKIVNFKIVSGGSTYTSTTNTGVKVYGDGSALTCSVGVTAGVVSSVTYTIASSSNFTYANILESDLAGSPVSTANKAVIRAIVAPSGGFGYDNITLLPTWFLGFPATFAGPGTETDSQSWFISASDNTDYRQISLIRDPSFNRAYPGRGLEITTLSRATYSGVTPVAGGYIVNSTTGARTYVDYVDTANSKIYYHTSYSSFGINSEPLVASASNTTAYNAAGGLIGTLNGLTITNIVAPEYTQYTGSVIFYENRAPIVRNSLQTEEIKIVIQF